MARAQGAMEGRPRLAVSWKPAPYPFSLYGSSVFPRLPLLCTGPLALNRGGQGHRSVRMGSEIRTLGSNVNSDLGAMRLMGGVGGRDDCVRREHMEGAHPSQADSCWCKVFMRP